VLIFEKSGHIPQVEEPEEFKKAVYDFLAAPSVNGNATKPPQR
jgi:hypothetical protein